MESPFLMGQFMTIHYFYGGSFHSYVKLPEGKSNR